MGGVNWAIEDDEAKRVTEQEGIEKERIQNTPMYGQRQYDKYGQATSTTVSFVETQAVPNFQIQTQIQKLPYKFPIFTLVISLFQIILYYCFSMIGLALIFGYDPQRRHEIWRYLTMMLAHSRGLHLWKNVICQLILGVLLEITHGWKRIGTIYMTSVLGGTLFLSVFTPQLYTIGASGACYGLLLAHLSNIILNWNEIDEKCCQLSWTWLLPLTFWQILIALLNLISANETQVSHACHLGGALTGFLMSILVLKNFQKRPWEKTMQTICAGILFGLFIVILLINISFPSLYPNAELNFDYLNTFVKHLFKKINQSGSYSQKRMACLNDPTCAELFNRYLFNGTVDIQQFANICNE